MQDIYLRQTRRVETKLPKSIFVAKNQTVFAHRHIPIQSACDTCTELLGNNMHCTIAQDHITII